jgi:hypothetical protein
VTQPVPVAPGVVADVPVLVISVDQVAQTAVIRVIDNNNNFLTPAVALPVGLIKPTAFQVSVGDVLEQATPEARTAVVRWVNDAGQWSESPTGVPGRDTVGWRKLGVFDLTP